MSVAGDVGVVEGVDGLVAVGAREAGADPVRVVGAVLGFDGEVADRGGMLDERVWGRSCGEGSEE